MHSTNDYFAASANQIGHGWFAVKKKLNLLNGESRATPFHNFFACSLNKSILLISYTKHSLLPPQISQLN